jgi:hypothetical protein
VRVEPFMAPSGRNEAPTPNSTDTEPRQTVAAATIAQTRFEDIRIPSPIEILERRTTGAAYNDIVFGKNFAYNAILFALYQSRMLSTIPCEVKCHWNPNPAIEAAANAIVDALLCA